MAEEKKLDLEEIKKSFPSLDGFSSKKLLGGAGGEYHNPWDSFHPTGTSNSGGSASIGGGGGGYFGDGDFGDDWGDDQGWGDDEQGGGDPNPGGSEGGNGQNSSGNPGTGQTTPDYSDLPFFNSTTPSQYEHRTYNNSSVTLYGKPDHDTPFDRVIVPPGGYTDVALDAFKVNGHVYKVTDRYGTLEVTDNYYQGHYSDEDIFWPFVGSPLEYMQDWLDTHGNPCHRSDFELGDTQWDNIFSPP